MAEEPEGNGFKEFIRGEIRNVKDAAARNYEEHQAINETLTKIRERLAAIEVLLEGRSTIRAAGLASRGVVVASIVQGFVALVVAVLAIILK